MVGLEWNSFMKNQTHSPMKMSAYHQRNRRTSWAVIFSFIGESMAMMPSLVSLK